MGAEVLTMGANGGFMIAAYTVTGLILAGYAAVLWLKSRRGKPK